MKLDNDGNALHPWQGPWACIWDQQTNLIWEVKTDSESIHDGYWSYSWFNGNNGIKNKGDFYFEEDRCDTLDLIERTNQEKLCQVAGWRLPNSEELLSLVDHSGLPLAATIEQSFFPHTKAGDYWTSDTEIKIIHGNRKETGANAVNFRSGQLIELPNKNAAFVRLVTIK